MKGLGGPARRRRQVLPRNRPPCQCGHGFGLGQQETPDTAPSDTAPSSEPDVKTEKNSTDSEVGS
jgi:hypothetical protein